jgi:transcriptional regulator with XRE-family HTH domain
MGEADDVVTRNRRQQIEWYGEPLGERVRRLLHRLGRSQASLAEIVGLSAPMLSQLMSGHRAKISNPAVFSRLLAVEELVADPEFDLLPAREVINRLEAIRLEGMAMPSPTAPVGAPSGSTPPGLRVTAGDPVMVIQSLLRTAASATEIESAAAMIEPEFPELATFLRVYGNGRTAEARAHLAETLGS